MLKKNIRKFKRGMEILFSDSISVDHERVIYRYKNPDWNKRLSMMSHPLSYNFPSLFKHYPFVIHAGVTNVCNLKCPICPATTGSYFNRPIKHMSLGVFKETVDAFRDSLMFMPLWGWGEPFTHPELPELIAYATRAGIKCVTSTNANVNNNPDYLKRIVESKLDVLIVCLDGATQETYEKYRVGGKLKEVLNTVERLNTLKQQMGTPYPVINTRVIPNKYNEKELPKIRKIAQEIGSEIFSLKSANPSDWGGKNLDDDLAPRRDKYSRYLYDGKDMSVGSRRERAVVTKFDCKKPVFGPVLASNGEMIFCCYEGEEHVFGDVSEPGSVKKLWFGPEFTKKRKKFLKNKGTRLCRNCYFRSTELPKTVLDIEAFRDLPSDISID